MSKLILKLSFYNLDLRNLDLIRVKIEIFDGEVYFDVDVNFVCPCGHAGMQVTSVI